MSGRSSIGILGSGTAARTLGAALVKHGRPVMLGSRTPSKLEPWRTAASDPPGVSSGRPGLFVGTTDSLGERIQRQLPDARVVKALNTVARCHGRSKSHRR